MPFKTLKKPKEDIRKFLKKKKIPSLAKALTKVMPKKHKQRFEHDYLFCNETQIGSMLKSWEKNGWELVGQTEVPNLDKSRKSSYTLFFKRPV